MGAFHAYDIRGLYGVEFTKDDAYKVGYFLPRLLNTDKVAIGHDCRLSSPEIYAAAIAGICDAGADAYVLGLATTPYVYFVTANYGFNASIQITASHNPKEYNGMKVSTTNALPVGLESGLDTIQQWILSGEPTPVASRCGREVEFDKKKEYMDFQKQFLGDYSDIKIGMDLSNGMSSLFVRDIFGAKPICINEEMDGAFPNHEPNPLIPANVAGLGELVRREHCDAGVIYDGDADRVVFVDEKGQFISPDLMIAVLGNWFLKKKGLRGKVLQDIRSSKAVGEYLTPMGAEMHTWKVGRAYAARKLREIDGIYGGELAGHYYFRDFFYSDSGILASILIMNIVADFKSHGTTLSEVIASIVRYKNSGEINFKLESKAEAMEAVKDYFMGAEKSTAFYDFDGYRVEFADWWFNIRPSNTEPYLRFICEAKTQEMLDEKVAKASEIIKSFS
jgi:phosphomannomutase